MKPNRFLQGILGLLAIALIIFVGAEARNAFQQYGTIGKEPHQRDTIAIDGMGKISATPDVAVVNLGVTSDGTTVQAVQKQNTDKMNAIIDALKAMDIVAKDIQTSNYSIYPKYDYSNGKQNIIGYTVSQNVTVKVRNLDKTGDVLAKAGELGMNQSGGVDFTIDDPTTLQAQARDKAIDDARQKAKQLTDKLGVSLGKVVTFTEGARNDIVPLPMMKAMNAAVGGGVASAPSPQIQSGSLDVISNVTVTFEVQ